MSMYIMDDIKVSIMSHTNHTECSLLTATSEPFVQMWMAYWSVGSSWMYFSWVRWLVQTISSRSSSLSSPS